MESLLIYLSMGGYAWFVWPSYVVSAGGLAWIAVASVRGMRAQRRALEELGRSSRGRASAETAPASESGERRVSRAESAR